MTPAFNISSEADLVEVFCRFLEEQGWETKCEVDFVDVVATKDREQIFAEVKGLTTDRSKLRDRIDKLFGQLLRRMSDDPSQDRQYAIVVPLPVFDLLGDTVEGRTLGVPDRILGRLNIRVYGVNDTGKVFHLA